MYGRWGREHLVSEQDVGNLNHNCVSCDRGEITSLWVAGGVPCPAISAALEKLYGPWMPAEAGTGQPFLSILYLENLEQGHVAIGWNWTWWHVVIIISSGKTLHLLEKWKWNQGLWNEGLLRNTTVNCEEQALGKYSIYKNSS